ncbi:SymE family type I addiction module toxin [Chitinophaga sp. CF418]|uniref:SymE family type I addiction module toxin n=1 Tax=Chitinophaga sp. CF418 TaxID=1855287 RepID=UPI00091F9DC0|nr:SymE family type I addiction module toxin [Chitinophaga sp. CF418]SHN29500.1 toxic protein SymE [Chitinophaga sp. CF418]
MALRISKAIRRGKLHGQYRTLSNHWNGGRSIPWLNVRGLWLEEAGFNVGDPIDIIVSKEKLIIKKAWDGK